jgi:hypothetical protein
MKEGTKKILADELEFRRAVTVILYGKRKTLYPYDYGVNTYEYLTKN